MARAEVARSTGCVMLGRGEGGLEAFGRGRMNAVAQGVPAPFGLVLNPFVMTIVYVFGAIRFLLNYQQTIYNDGPIKYGLAASWCASWFPFPPTLALTLLCACRPVLLVVSGEFRKQFNRAVLQ